MNVIFLQDEKYPVLLRELKDAPKQLYYKGRWDETIFENCLAVVGSRQMTAYGRQVVEKIVGEAAAAGLTIVSGFMYGVDAAAHKAALKAGGRTIAVMPCGIDLIHPEHQQDLYVEILDNKGLVISEYQGDAQPAYWTYPQRNRIVAGLSRAVLIVEAGEKSGSLITAGLAKKFGRKVFVVPGPITSQNSKGIMRLMRQGAAPVADAEDILKYYRKESKSGPEAKIIRDRKGIRNVNRSEGEILDILQREPMHIDDLARALARPASELGTILSLLELRGLIRREGPKYYPI